MSLRNLVELIARETADQFDLGHLELLRLPRRGDRRGSQARRIAKVRHIAMWLARSLLYDGKRELGSYPQIGKVLCRHHTSVMYGVRKAEEMMNRDGLLHAKVMRIRQRLQPKIIEARAGYFPQLTEYQYQLATGYSSTSGAERTLEGMMA